MKRASAFSLVEVTLALGIAGFALVAIFGLLPTGLNSNRTALEQTAAANIATAIASDLRATPSTKTISPLLQADLANSGTYYLDENGGPFPAATSLTDTTRYRVTVAVTIPPAAQRTATGTCITISWPPGATLQTAAGTLTTFVALDRN